MKFTFISSIIREETPARFFVVARKTNIAVAAYTDALDAGEDMIKRNDGSIAAGLKARYVVRPADEGECVDDE